MDWQTYYARIVAWLTQTWQWLTTIWQTAERWDVMAFIQAIRATVSERILQASIREQALVLTAAVICVLALMLIRRWQRRIYRQPLLAQQAILADVALLMTQLRGRARRPAKATYRALTRRIKQSRSAFDGASWERLWAQWKQADREVGQLLNAMRRSRTHVVRIEQYQHLSTLRDTVHAQVHGKAD